VKEQAEAYPPKDSWDGSAFLDFMAGVGHIQEDEDFGTATERRY